MDKRSGWVMGRLGCLFLLLISFSLRAEEAVSLAAPPVGAANSATAEAARGTKIEVSKPPRRIAVLPALGDATKEHKDDVRMAVHNNLSSKAFELLKPFEVDEALIALRQTDGLVLETASPETLAKKLDVDGLLFLDVPAVSKIYVGAYAQQTVQTQLKLYALNKNAMVWEKTSSETEREGGISLNVLSMIATAVTSTFVLTDGVRRTLIDRLARSVTADIPTPEGARGSVPPPRIETALSNAFEGPFHSGDEVKVAMTAEPGVAATFSLGARIVRQKLEEKSPGQYLGRYVVQEGDNAEQLLMTIQVVRPRDRATLEWRVAGSVGLDTVPPAAVTALRGRPVREGLRINWEAPATAEKLRFQLEKADATGVFKPVGDTEVSEWLDTSVEPGKSYFYRVTAVDAAKNRSSVAQQRVTHVATGPTKVVGDIAEDTTWYALASPYLVDGALRVLPAAALHLEPGVVVEFSPKASIEVLGRLDAAGSAEGVIQLQGPEWTLAIKSAAAQGNRLAHVRGGGASGSIVIDGGKINLSEISLTGMSTALVIDGASEVDLQKVAIERAKTALTLKSGRVKVQDLRLVLSDLGVLFDRQGFSSSRNVTFDRNVVHARSAGGVLLDDVRFSETDYSEVMARLPGVRVNWAALNDEKNLRARWLDGRLKVLATMLGQKAWVPALATVEQLDDATDHSLTALRQVLLVLSSRPAGAPSVLGDAADRLERQRAGSALLLLQEASMPYRAQLAESVLVTQAKTRTPQILVDAFYPQRLQPGGAWLSKLGGRIRASQVISTQRAGALQRYWVAHVIDGAAVEQDLLLAGAIVKENVNLKIGLINVTEHQEALLKLTATLETHKFRYVNLGQGNYGEPMRQKARELGVNLIIEMNQSTRLQDSELSSTLKQIEARMSLALHDVQADRPLNRLNTQGSAIDFRGAAGVGKVISEAYGKIEQDTVRALWAASVVFDQRGDDPLVSASLPVTRPAATIAEPAVAVSAAPVPFPTKPSMPVAAASPPKAVVTAVAENEATAAEPLEVSDKP